MNKQVKKLLSLLLALGILLSSLPLAAAEEGESFLFPVFTGGKGFVGEFLLKDDILYISTDTILTIGEGVGMDYSEFVIGGPDRIISRSMNDKEISWYLYESEGDYIDAEDGKTYVNYIEAMGELCISTYCGTGQLLVAEPANQVKYLQNRLLSIRRNNVYGMSSLRDQQILAITDLNDVYRYMYLMFNGGKNLDYLGTLSGATSVESYQKAIRKILLPTTEEDFSFKTQSAEFVSNMAAADDLLDILLDDGIIEAINKGIDNNEVLNDLVRNVMGCAEIDVTQYHKNLIGKFDMANEFLQVEERIANSVFLENIDKIEADMVAGLENVMNCSDNVFDGLLNMALAAELSQFHKGEASATIYAEMVRTAQGSMALGDELIFDDIGAGLFSGSYSQALASLGAYAISEAGDYFFDTQDKIDATLMLTSYLDISEVAYDAIGTFCNRYWGLEWGSGKGEMLQHMRNVTMVYLKACRTAWEASLLEGKSDAGVESMIKIINEELDYITSFEDRDFTVIKDAMATSELLKTKADMADSTTVINITWDASKGDPDISFYSYGTETSLNDDGTAYVTKEGQPVASITAAEGSATYMIFGGFGACEMQVARLQNDMSELGVSIYATTTGEDGTSQHCSPDEYLDYGATRVWYYGLVIDEFGTLMPSYEYWD